MEHSNNVKKNASNISIANYLNHLNIITTPYEKVLSIIKDAKNYIAKTSNNKNKLITDLQWVLKIITTHSLYTYQIKEKDLINKLSKENEEFKQYIKFVTEYNEKIIEMNKKINVVGEKSLDFDNELLEKSSLKLKRIKYKRKNSLPARSFKNFAELSEYQNSPAKNKYKENKKLNKAISNINQLNIKIDKNNKSIKNFNTNSFKVSKNNGIKKRKKNLIKITDDRIPNDNIVDTHSLFNKFSFFINKTSKKKINSYFKTSIENSQEKSINKSRNQKKNNNKTYHPYIKIDISANKSKNKINNNSFNNNISNKPTFNTINSSHSINQNNSINSNTYNSYMDDIINSLKTTKNQQSMKKSTTTKKRLFSASKKNILPHSHNFSYSEIEKTLIRSGYDYKQILDKNFNIFKLKK